MKKYKITYDPRNLTFYAMSIIIVSGCCFILPYLFVVIAQTQGEYRKAATWYIILCPSVFVGVWFLLGLIIGLIGVINAEEQKEGTKIPKPIKLTKANTFRFNYRGGTKYIEYEPTLTKRYRKTNGK